jgi:alanine racemase
MMNSFRPTYADIHLKNLDFNLYSILDVAGKGRFVCPMIKANAYGHGAVPVAQRILKNALLPLGVVLIEEALELRSAGIGSEIIVFGGFDFHGARQIIDAKLTAVVNQFEQLEFLNQLVTDSIDIHIKFNTGMNRLGFNSTDVDQVILFLKNHPKIKVKAILSHLHSSQLSYQENSTSAQQALLMLKIIEQFKEFGVHAHLLNSDAIANLAQVKNHPLHFLNQYNWGFRPGIMLYGYRTQDIPSPMIVKPVMSLKSSIAEVRHIKKGEVVSYDGTWVADRDSSVAIAPIGYADGVHRLLSHRAKVFVKNKKVPMIGRICMDFLMLDVTEIVSLDLKNSEVIFFDDLSQGADVLAKAAETISYEILTSVSSRVPRRYIESGGPL